MRHSKKYEAGCAISYVCPMIRAFVRKNQCLVKGSQFLERGFELLALTLLTTMPPKLCATKIIGRCFARSSCRSPSSLSIKDRAASSISATELLNTYAESYPNDRILALGIVCGTKSLNHIFWDVSSVHVFSQSPPSPWTATRLAFCQCSCPTSYY
jgi:hypothetical protein